VSLGLSFRLRVEFLKMSSRLQAFAEEFVTSTRRYLFVRPEDGVLILRPNKVHHLNTTAAEMLNALYSSEVVDTGAVVAQVAAHYQVPAAQVEADLDALLRSLSVLLSNRSGCAPAVKQTPFGTHQRLFPVLAEIALTYRCQNRCTFCYASAPERGRKVPAMSTTQVQAVIDKIVDQAHIPSLSFTGGEPTLRRDLPELVAYGHARGLWMNLITNGIRCARPGFVEKLAQAGLDSAQVSLEAGEAATHDRVVGRQGAFQRTVQGIRNLKEAGINVHTNTTINQGNLEALHGLIDLVAGLGLKHLSMNMVIRTGGAVGQEDIGYTDIGVLVLSLKNHAEDTGLKFVWYSPVPFCLFNPAAFGLGSPSCSAADGLLSISPDGTVLPCSSFEQGVGNLLNEEFDAVWNRRTAKYWRNKEFMPPGCQECEYAQLCCGACPLYWDEQKTLAEIAPHLHPTAPWSHAVWRVKRRILGRVHGVGIR
jgi:radical SAM protein with 4Fe4S-binding SPASM domain